MMFLLYMLSCLTPVSLLDLKRSQHLMFSLKTIMPESKIMKTKMLKVSFL